VTEFINERLDLGDKIISVHLSPVYTTDKYLGTVSVLRDITREVEADRSKSQFVSNVSHEFRTPLTPIKGYTDLLLMGAAGDVSDQQKKVLSTIKENVERLTALVEDVLSISQIDSSGRHEMKIEDVNLNEAIETIVSTLQSRANNQRKNLEVNFSSEMDEPVVQADREKVNRIIGNIIDNAFNYTRPGGTIDIDIRTDSRGRNLYVVVKDSGVGIPADFQDNVWRRFERHDETALALDVAGTGLGLPIVKELVEMHGGSVSFESEVGVGTTFTIAMPIRQPEFRKGVTGPLTAAGSD
jgi:signal transduction histidine kinase